MWIDDITQPEEATIDPRRVEIDETSEGTKPSIDFNRIHSLPIDETITITKFWGYLRSKNVYQ